MSLNVMPLFSISRIIITLLIIAIIILYYQQHRLEPSSEDGLNGSETNRNGTPNARKVDHTDDMETVKRYSNIVTHYSDWSLKPDTVKCYPHLKVQKPVTKIYIKETRHVNCHNYERCVATAGLEQMKHHYGRRYHFLIGGDGSIFEELAWSCMLEDPRVDAKSIVVSLTGWSRGQTEYQDTQFEVNTKQYSSLKLFIKANLIIGNLSPYYELLPYCCTSVATQLGPTNPGKMVYENLTLFERFNGDGCLRNAKCRYED